MFIASFKDLFAKIYLEIYFRIYILFPGNHCFDLIKINACSIFITLIIAYDKSCTPCLKVGRF
jgi:hypothetical protein